MRSVGLRVSPYSTVSAKKTALLGMPFGTACNRLRKQVLYALVVETGRDRCFRCGCRITRVDDLSLDHKQSWIKSSTPVINFFDTSAIVYSHRSCNSAARDLVHGSKHSYEQLGCRCAECREAHRVNVAGWRERKRMVTVV